jgi:hypothetical protein
MIEQGVPSEANVTGMSQDSILPGTTVELRGLCGEVVEATPMGDQTLLRLRGTGGAFAGSEVGVLTPFEEVRPVSHVIDPTRPTLLANWLVYHQAFLLEKALGTGALVAVQPGGLRTEPYQLVPVARCLGMTRPRLLLADDVGLGKTIEAGLALPEAFVRHDLEKHFGPTLPVAARGARQRSGLCANICEASHVCTVGTP